MKVCVYTICKNEENNLINWYSRVATADLICVLDTGSTDNTNNILKCLSTVNTNFKYTQKSYSEFSFCDARNDSLAFARQFADEDFVMIHIDLDEMLTENCIEEIRSQYSAQYDSILLQVYNVNNMLAVKGHKNDKDITWEYDVHEKTAYKDFHKMNSLIISGAGYNHYQDKSKVRDYYEKLKRANEKKPNCIHYLTYLIWEAYLHEEFYECLHYSLESIKQIKENKKDEFYLNYDYLAYATYTLYDLSIMLNTFEEYSSIIYENLSLVDKNNTHDMKSIHYYLAEYYSRTNDIEKANEEYLKVIYTESYNDWIEREYDLDTIRNKIVQTPKNKTQMTLSNNDNYYMTGIEDNKVKNKVAAYGICKNELKFIDRCFTSISNADYICILDTGSTDGTYEYLLKLQEENPEKYFIGRQVFEKFRFDDARNAAMTLIPSDTTICVSVDMDDVFRNNWREVIENNFNAGYTKVIGKYIYYENDTEGATTNLDRAHLYGKAHWEEALHERIICEQENIVYDDAFIVEHRQDLQKDRRTSYYDIAKNASESSDYAALCFGYESSNIGNYNDCIDTIESLYSRLVNTGSQYITRKVLLLLYNAYMNIGDKEMAQDSLFRALKIDARNSPFEDYYNYDGRIEKLIDEFYLYFKLAKDAFDNKEYLKAVSYVDICLVLNKDTIVKETHDLYVKTYLEFIKNKTYETNKVAVYAITKNEIKFVDKWYESMKEADYICVLDTGSTDGTYEKFLELSKIDKRIIVKQQIFAPWRFDLPRNIAMTLVPDDANIFFSTDLDEVLEKNWYEELKNNWIQNRHERGVYLYAWSHNQDGSPARVFNYNKVHAANWIWKYPVHELLYCLNTNSENYVEYNELRLNSVYLHHYPDLTKSRGNYLTLLEQRAKEDENDTYGLIYLSHEYYYKSMYQQSIDTLNRVLATKNLSTEMMLETSCYLFLGDNYRELGQQEKAIECYKKAIEVDPLYREPYLNLADLLIVQKRYDEAISEIKAALNISVRRFNWLERDISWTYQPYDLLCLAYYYSGDKVKALACAYKASELDKSDDRLRNNINLVLETISDKEW